MTGWGQIYLCAYNSHTPWWNVLNFYQPVQNTLAVLVQSLCLKKHKFSIRQTDLVKKKFKFITSETTSLPFFSTALKLPIIPLLLPSRGSSTEFASMPFFFLAFNPIK